MSTMEITTNKKVDKTILRIVKESFEKQKNIRILSLYVKDNDIYGIYVNGPNESLSFTQVAPTDMRTDIDGHNIFMFELGLLLTLIYKNGSAQMFNILTYPSAIDCESNLFLKLMSICINNPPLNLSSFHLIKWIDELNSGNLNMSTNDLIDMVEEFNQIEQLDVDVSDTSSESIMKNNLNLVKQELMSKKYDKITEATIARIDKIFVQLQLNLYTTDDKKIYKNV